MAGDVLLVEDNPDDAELVRLFFGRTGIGNNLIVTHSGREALRLLHREALDPELVLLDLGLPDISGFQVLEAIRADVRTVDLPVIILTISSDFADIREGYSAGANHYLVKPFDFLELLAATRQIRMHWSVARMRV